MALLPLSTMHVDSKFQPNDHHKHHDLSDVPTTRVKGRFVGGGGAIYVQQVLGASLPTYNSDVHTCYQHLAVDRWSAWSHLFTRHRPAGNEWCLGRNKAGDLWREVLRPSLTSSFMVRGGGGRRAKGHSEFRTSSTVHRPRERELPFINAARIFQKFPPVGGVLAVALVTWTGKPLGPASVPLGAHLSYR